MKSEFSIVETRQIPLRRLYTEDEGAAITVKHVRTVHQAAADPIHGAVVAVGDYPETVWRYGTDDKVGGFDDLPHSGHILCASLAACMDNITRMIADRLCVELQRLEVDVTGDVDVRGCLAIDPSARPGFREIRCIVHLKADDTTDPRHLKLLTSSAEQLCVTLDTLRNGVPVDVSFDLDGKGQAGARYVETKRRTKGLDSNEGSFESRHW